MRSVSVPSLKIKAISFLAICAVIAWHCDCGSRVEGFVIPWLTLWSVPWFFMVSGYFFFLSLQKYRPLELSKKKIQSLVLPYVLWCILGWCFWQPEFPSGVGRAMCSLFGLQATIFPAGNWPLWYTRALLIFMMSGIVVYAMFRRIGSRYLKYILLAFSLLSVRFGVQWLGVGVSPGGSPWFFLAGAALACWNVRLTSRLGRWATWSIALCDSCFILYTGHFRWT